MVDPHRASSMTMNGGLAPGVWKNSRGMFGWVSSCSASAS